MVRPRRSLSEILHEFCPNVYFQPPEGTLLKYPCIVYKLDHIDTVFADNVPYDFDSRYAMTYMTTDPDDENRYRLLTIPMCKFDRTFPSGNLHHYTYTLYY